MSQLNKEKRSTRGKRMTALIGKAAEEDDAFWGAGDAVWQESDDESFSDAEIEPDQFDSDFNDSEDEEEESEEDEKSLRKESAPSGAKGGSNKYKEPVKRKVNTSSSSSSAVTVTTDSIDNGVMNSNTVVVKAAKRVKFTHDNHSGAANMQIIRTVRTSTKEKTESAESIRKQKEDSIKKLGHVRRPQIKHQFTQEELLMDALNTEQVNQRWLLHQKCIEQNNNIVSKCSKSLHTNDVVRYLSRRGTYDTITFNNVDSMPAILNDCHDVPTPTIERKCYVTNKKAKYHDPLTGHYYADVDAFKQIRRLHAIK